MRGHFLQSSLLILLAAIFFISSALADEDPDVARALFKEARQLVSDGKYAKACALFEKSLKQQAGIGTQFNLADCWEHTGKIASAYELFREVAATSKESGQSDREHVARRRAEALEPQLSRLQLKFDESIANVRVTHDGVVIPDKSWRDPTPVDPGPYEVASVSGGKVLWKTQVVVPPKALTVLVKVPSDNRNADAETVAEEAPAASKRKLRRAEPHALPQSKSRQDSSGVLPATALLIGTAGLATGTVFALILQSKNSQARDICPTSVGCSDSDIRTHDGLVSDAKTARAASFIAFGVGAASISAATIYYITRPTNREKPPPTAWRLAPMVGATNGGIWGAAAQGSW